MEISNFSFLTEKYNIRNMAHRTFNGSIQDIEVLATFVWLSFRLVRNPSDIMAV